MIMATGLKVYVVIDPNFRVRGVYSSNRQALEITKGQKGYNVEVWVVDGNDMLPKDINMRLDNL